MMGAGRIRRRVGQAIWSARTAFSNRAAILLYHRVAKVSADPWQLCVTPEHFADHIACLKRSHRVLSLTELVRRLTQSDLPPNAVAITFDDGYADNLTAAKPLLEALGLPATVFAVSGAIGKQSDFWWDQLATLLLEPARLPPKLALELGSQRWDFAVDNRKQLHDRVYAILRRLAPVRRQQALEQIAEWAAADADWQCRNPILDSQQMMELARGDLIEIGAHTVTHPTLADLPLTEQRIEIMNSRQQLEHAVRRKIVHFAYPHGSHKDFSPDTARLVEDSGFQSACAAEGGATFASSNLFSLPRLMVGDWDGETFERNLSQWLRV